MLAWPAAATAAPLPLPPPLTADAQGTELCGAVGSRPDRCLQSFVPGPVRNDEIVRVRLDGAGKPAVVELEQRLLLTGEGDYAIRERGPARQARTLGELDPPVTKFGAVVWQGFSPGERELAALLTLDAGLEEVRLPFAVTTTFTPTGGTPRPLGAGGTVTGPGTVRVVVTNSTTQPAELPAGTDASAAVLAPLLDALRVRAALDRQALGAPSPPPGAPAPGTRLPAAGAGLPATVEVATAGRVRGEQSVPLNLALSLTGEGSALTPTSPGAAVVPGGAQLVGTLPGGQQVALTATVAGPARVVLTGTAVPALDPRSLVAPVPSGTWADWERTRPDAGARRAALDLLVSSAAAGARAASYSPYLGADLPGTGTTVFELSFAEPEALPEVAERLSLRKGPLAVTGVALLLLLVHGGLLWRRS